MRGLSWPDFAHDVMQAKPPAKLFAYLKISLGSFLKTFITSMSKRNMVLRYPSYKLPIFILMGANIVTIILIPLRASILSMRFEYFGDFWRPFLAFNLSIIIPFLLFRYWNINMVFIDGQNKTVTVTKYVFHFLKLAEYRFNTNEITFEIQPCFMAESGDYWRLYLYARNERFVIEEAVFKSSLIKIINKIGSILEQQFHY